VDPFGFHVRRNPHRLPLRWKSRTSEGRKKIQIHISTRRVTAPPSATGIHKIQIQHSFRQGVSQSPSGDPIHMGRQTKPGHRRTAFLRIWTASVRSARPGPLDATRTLLQERLDFGFRIHNPIVPASPISRGYTATDLDRLENTRVSESRAVTR
jgi:hypothetical protein